MEPCARLGRSRPAGRRSEAESRIEPTAFAGIAVARLAARMLVVVCAAVAPGAGAGFHSYQIESVYSNADGSVQYVVLHETQGLNNERFFAGRTLTSTHGTATKTHTFQVDLPGTRTANRRVLIGTQGLADLRLVAPDYIIPGQFLATDGGTLNFAGVDQVAYGALPTNGILAIGRTGASTPAVATNFAGATAAMPALAVTTYEYYHAGLDHYFISNLQPDIDALDSGRIAGWSRTGHSFRVFPTQASGGPGVSPVCRFYIPPAHGNSHFFSASPAECATIAAKVLTDPNYSGYVQETSEAFYIALPDTTTGACPPGARPVFRLWNQRADSNHRYTIDAAVKAQMIASSYVAEGYGPNATIMCAPAPGNAFVQFLMGATAPYGALVSDGASVPAANYQGYATASSTANVGPRNGSGEIVAFGSRRAVTVQPATWSTGAGDQTLPVSMGGELEAPITIWVVASPFSTQQQTALTLWNTAQQIYWDERLGMRLPLEVVDATANPKASLWNAFVCGAGNANVTAIQADIGVRPGRVNVYLVNLVDGSTSRGNACSIGGSFVAIAAGAGAELLSHELGHDFALEHVDDLAAAFDVTNVMHSASNSRLYLTEGQSFRAHLHPASAINAIYGLRPGLVTRACDRDTLILGCPAIAKRIWSDGAFPAN
jgi:hypothetical protein